ncbi:hypothetical protein IFR04_002244, partial [Cadophora malorum]
MSKSIVPNPRVLSSLSRNACSQSIRTGPICRNLSTSTSVLANSRRGNGSGVGAATRCLQAVRRDAVALGGYGRWSVTAGRSAGSVRGYKTVQEAKSRYKSGPFSTLAGILFLSSGAGLIFYFRYEKARMERKRVAEAAKGVGRPKVGGPFG